MISEDQALEIAKTIGNALNVGATEVWRVAVRQSYVDAGEAFFFIALWAAMTVFWTRRAFAEKVWWIREDYQDFPGPKVFSTGLAGASFFVFMMVTGGGCSTGLHHFLTGIFNPEYKAIELMANIAGKK